LTKHGKETAVAEETKEEEEEDGELQLKHGLPVL
jgi:hypothetical protein